MHSSPVKSVKLNAHYLINQNIDQVSFWDNYQLNSTQLKQAPAPKDMMIAFFKAFPKSFIFLLRTRERIAKWLRLKTADESDSKIETLHQFKGEIGDRIALFEVLAKNEQELMTGQNDSHLDFKLSFISYADQTGVKLELATTVIINNKIGKFYFAVVKPFHRFYLKRIIKRMEHELVNQSW